MVDDTTFRRLVRSRDFLAAQYASPVRLHEAAAAACLSPYHFHRLFLRTFGVTPHGFVTARRLDAAKRLLAAEELPVTEVCQAVGFESLGSFGTLFRERVGLAPGAYRRELRRVYTIPWAPVYVPACFMQFYVGAK